MRVVRIRRLIARGQNITIFGTNVASCRRLLTENLIVLVRDIY